MPAKENRQINMQRRGFLGRMAAVLGVPLALPANARNQASGQQGASGVYYRAHQSEFSPGVDWSPWHEYPRIPILESSAGNEPIFIEAIERNEVLYGSYDRWGDSAIRRINPIQLFKVERDADSIDRIYEPELSPDRPNTTPPWIKPEEPSYLLAWDHDRRAARTFLAEHFSPLFTAPWMQRYAGELSQSEWKSRLQRTENALRERGIEPVNA